MGGTPGADVRPGAHWLKSHIKLDAMNHYEVLGVRVNANREEIRGAYRRLAFQYHPDRTATAEVEEDLRHLGLPRAEVFSLVSTAYSVLSDDLRRSMYDIVMGLREHSDKEIARMSEIKRQQAVVALENMLNTVELNRAKEKARRGLLVEQARYGRLQGRSSLQFSIDVAAPLQCMVQDSRLILKGGESKSWLPGFHDPCEGEAKQLRVLYRFASKLHEVVVGDHDDLRLPLRAHLLPDQPAAERDLKQERRAAQERRASGAEFLCRRRSVGGTIAAESVYARMVRQRRRRRQMLWAAALVLVGLVVARRRPEWLHACVAAAKHAVVATRQGAGRVVAAVYMPGVGRIVLEGSAGGK